MKELKLQINKPLDRDYFKYRDNPRRRKSRLTDCCGQDKDWEVLNVNEPEDWERVEHHIEDTLDDYPSTEAITPISCKVCGRLLRYETILNDKAWEK